MSNKKEFYNEYVTAHTAQVWGEVNPATIKRQFPVWKKYYGKIIPESRDTKLLELGCGDGAFLYYLKELGYKNLRGVDLSPQQLEIAHRLGVDNVEQADIIDFLTVTEERYDVIIARDVIEHFTKDEIVVILKKILNRLKPGGQAVLQVPNAIGPFGSRHRYADFTHEISFTRASLNQLFRTVGFNSTAFYPTGPVAKGFKSAIRWLLWKVIELKLKTYLLIETGVSNEIYTQIMIGVGKKEE